MLLKGLFSGITNFVLPHRCISCSELTEQGDGLCSRCFSKLNFISSPYCKICGFPFEFDMEDQYECGKCISEPPKYELARSLFKFDPYSKKLFMDLNIMTRLTVLSCLRSYYLLGIKMILRILI